MDDLPLLWVFKCWVLGAMYLKGQFRPMFDVEIWEKMFDT